MPRLPDKSDLGGLPIPAAPGSIITGSQYGAGILPKAIGDVGGTIEGIGEQRAQQQDVLDAAKWEAYRRPRYESLVDQFHQDPDYSTFEPRFKQAVKQIDDEAMPLVRNPQLAERLRYKAAVEADGALRRVLTYGSRLRNQDEVVKLDDSIGGIVGSAASPRNSAEDVDEALRQAKAYHDEARARGIIQPAQAHHIWEKHVTGVSGVLPRIANARNFGDDGQPNPQNLIDLEAATGRRSAADGEALEPRLVQRESSGRADLVNKLGYAGLYQFGAPRLADLGIYTPGDGENVSDRKAAGGWSGDKWSGEFHIPGFDNVKTLQDFLANPEAQRAAYRQQIARADVESKSAGLDKYIGKTVGGVQITQDGLRAMIHLGGLDSTRKALESGGRSNPADANGTTVLDYAKMGVGTKTASSERGTPSGWADIYAKMSPQALQHQLTNARTAMHNTLLQQGRDAESYAENYGELPRDSNGKTILDRSVGVLNQNQITKIKQGTDAAIARFKGVSGVSDLDPDQAEARIRTELSPENQAAKAKAEGKEPLPYATAAKTQQYVGDFYQRYRKWAENDSGQAVLGGNMRGPATQRMSRGEDGQLQMVDEEGTESKHYVPPAPEIKAAIATINSRRPDLQIEIGPDGVPTAAHANDPAGSTWAQEQLIDAMLQAQKRRRLPQHVLTRDQAKKLLGDSDPATWTDAEMPDKIREAENNAKAYGKYADKALLDAVSLVSKLSREQKDQIRTAAQLMKGHLSLDDLAGARVNAWRRELGWFESGLPTGEPSEGQGAEAMGRAANQGASFDPWATAHENFLPGGASQPFAQPSFANPATDMRFGADTGTPGLTVGMYPQPTPRNIEWLEKRRADIGRTADQIFNKHFGGGAAERALGPYKRPL